ncbi:GIY-YIG nuclease family protein [uncultured Hymenobacter sp.]|uniref:GIY-YIG nuclease family protein n=1 Tax=uncultured Hymenobacter sp. TaxID=170016 RepID=UPI0035C9FFCD
MTAFYLFYYITTIKITLVVYVYLLTNPNRTVLYIGVTNDLNRRLHEHGTTLGHTGKFTGRYQTNLLVYFELHPDQAQAIAREKELKGWSRAKKEKLIAGFNPTWEALDLETWAGELNDK